VLLVESVLVEADVNEVKVRVVVEVVKVGEIE
jgi:hypothetical protein